MPAYAKITLALPILLDPTVGGVSLKLGTQQGTPNVYTKERNGEFRQYAGNRIRLVVANDAGTNVPITFDNVTVAQAQQINIWIGATLLYRDTYGSRLWGSFLSVDNTFWARTSPPIAQVALTFQTVTVDEEAFL